MGQQVEKAVQWHFKMVKTSDMFVEYVVDQLSTWGEVSVRRMFGGAGLYHKGTMFGLIAEDIAYLKVDDSSLTNHLRGK